MDLTASVLVAHAVSVPVKAVLVQENALVDQLVCVKTRQFAVLKHHQNSTTVHTTIIIIIMLAIIMCTSA